MPIAEGAAQFTTAFGSRPPDNCGISFATVPRGILLVTVVAVAAIGTCPDVMPERPLPDPFAAAVMRPFAFTVMFALVKLPTLELTVAKVRA